MFTYDAQHAEYTAGAAGTRAVSNSRCCFLAGVSGCISLVSCVNGFLLHLIIGAAQAQQPKTSSSYVVCRVWQVDVRECGATSYDFANCSSLVLDLTLATVTHTTRYHIYTTQVPALLLRDYESANSREKSGVRQGTRRQVSSANPLAASAKSEARGTSDSNRSNWRCQ
jgi:hypothetical protein